MVANCILNEIINPYTDESIEKEEFGKIVALVDFFVVVCFMIFIAWLEKAQQNYVNTYKDMNLELDDFTIRVKKLPHHDKYKKNDDVLRALLVTHFESIIKDELKNRGEEIEEEENEKGGLCSCLTSCFGKDDKKEEDDFDNIGEDK